MYSSFLSFFVSTMLLASCTAPTAAQDGPALAVANPAPAEAPVPIDAPPAPAVHPVLGVRVAPESRSAPYNRSAYRYPSSIEQRIINAQGGHFSPYSLRCFTSLRQTDIEHIVATSEAHDSGMAMRSNDEKARFAQDLANLTTAAPGLNRHQKSGKDPAEWMPANNRCWYVGVWVGVKRKYGLTMDQAEVDAILPVYQACASYGVVVPGCAR